MSLDADSLAMTRSAAAQIDNHQGTSAADIPVEQPTKFDVYFNLKTARLLNLTIPPSLLALADMRVRSFRRCRSARQIRHGHRAAPAVDLRYVR
jgi:hypothetical protein